MSDYVLKHRLFNENCDQPVCDHPNLQLGLEETDLVRICFFFSAVNDSPYFNLFISTIVYLQVTREPTERCKMITSYAFGTALASVCCQDQTWQECIILFDACGALQYLAVNVPVPSLDPNTQTRAFGSSCTSSNEKAILWHDRAIVTMTSSQLHYGVFRMTCVHGTNVLCGQVSYNQRCFVQPVIRAHDLRVPSTKQEQTKSCNRLLVWPGSIPHI